MTLENKCRELGISDANLVRAKRLIRYYHDSLKPEFAAKQTEDLVKLMVAYPNVDLPEMDELPGWIVIKDEPMEATKAL